MVLQVLHARMQFLNENGMTSDGSMHIMFKNLTQNHKMHKLQKKGGEIHRYTCFK